MDEKKVIDTNLDPEVEKIRDQIISKIGDKPLDEVNKIIKKLLMENMDETMRLAALAARVKIIRGKISLLYDNKVDLEKQKIKPKLTKTYEEENIKKPEDKWIRIKMLEAGEVNGKQIDKDVILDVKEEDSKILINAKKAEIVLEEKQNSIEKDAVEKTQILKSEKKESVISEKEGKKTDKDSLPNQEDKKVVEDTNDLGKSDKEDTKIDKNLLDKHVEKEKETVSKMDQTEKKEPNTITQKESDKVSPNEKNNSEIEKVKDLEKLDNKSNEPLPDLKEKNSKEKISSEIKDTNSETNNENKIENKNSENDPNKTLVIPENKEEDNEEKNLKKNEDTK